MLTPDEVKDLTDQLIEEGRLPLNTGDRIEVARNAIETTVRRLAVMVTLDRHDGPKLPGAIDETVPPAKPTEG